MTDMCQKRHNYKQISNNLKYEMKDVINSEENIFNQVQLCYQLVYWLHVF